jgi:mRNA-degrading endonuclease RelE of RelBE toxin-antitoxin system
VNHVLELVSVNNFIGKPIEKTKFRTIIVLQFSIIYQVNEENIIVILFWNTHRDPKILKILLQELQ